MIIKSMSRKNTSFAQLIKYFEKEQVNSRFSWNLYSCMNDRDSIIKEFESNSKYLKNARGKVYLYHEVLSLEKNNLSIKKQQEILQDLSKKYISQRANESLVYGVIHNDTNNLHMHLMISSNKVLSSKRERLSKKEFKTIQHTLEQYKNEYYKELTQTNFYEQKQYTKSKQSKKEFVRENLEYIFKRSLSKVSLENALKNQGFTIKQKGVNFVVEYENKTYRLKTLDLDIKYKQTLSRHIKTELRKEKRQEFKQEL